MSKTRVPVANRSPRPKRQLRLPAVDTQRLDIPSLAVIAFVLLIILGAVYAPMKNFFDGRTEIARLNESIAAKQAEKDALLEEIGHYDDEAFVRQEARRRLGVIEPGETAWRIVDPRLTPESSVTTSSTDEAVQPEWYEVLWDSVATSPSPAGDMHLPVQ